MSIATQINRIKDEVSNQSILLNEINKQIENKENPIESLNCMIDGTGTRVYNPAIRKVRNFAFYHHPTIEEIDIPNAYVIADYCAQYAPQLKKINAPKVVSVGNYLCSYNDTPIDIYMPNLQSIQPYTFQHGHFKDLIFPILIDIPSQAFANITVDNLILYNAININSAISGSTIKRLSLPAVTKINNTISNSTIQELELPLVEEISSGLMYIQDLTSLSLPKLKTINYGIIGCSNLINIYCPELTYVSGGLLGCGFSSISDDNFPKLKSIQGNAIGGGKIQTINSTSITDINSSSSTPCFFTLNELTTVVLPNLEYMGGNSFYSCPNLTDIYLLGEITAYLDSNAIYNCPKLSIWVPNELYTDYLNTTDETVIPYIWPISTPTIKNQQGEFSGMVGETVSVLIPWRNVVNASVSVNCTNCTYSNIQTSDKGVTFNITFTTKGEGSCTCTISGDATSTSTFSTYALSADDFSYSVTNRSTSYGFTLNSSTGYYVSNNKGVNSSYAVCRVYFYNDYDGGNMPSKIYIDCISSGESNYDFGIIGKKGYSLSLSSNEDSSSSIYKSFKGLSSTAVQTVVYNNFGTSGGYLDIKYKKDSSSHSGNDSLQFKIRFS